MTDWPEESLRRVAFALPDDGLPFGAIDALHKRLAYDEQWPHARQWMWKSVTRQILRELVRQDRVIFYDGRYFRNPAKRVEVPRRLRIPLLEKFEPLWPEVSRGPWLYGDGK